MGRPNITSVARNTTQRVGMLSGLFISLYGLHLCHASISASGQLHGRCCCADICRVGKVTRVFGTLSPSLSWNQMGSFLNPSKSTRWIFSIRGGNEDADSSDEVEVEEKEESDEDEDSEHENEIAPSKDEQEDVSEHDTVDEEEGIVDEDEGDEEASTKSSTKQTGGPIKLIVKTGLNSPLIDQTWESTCSRSRTIASIKQSLSRQMRGRPPASLQRLLLNGVQELHDDVLLDDIAPMELEDEDDEEEDQGMVKLQLILDMPPPVDAKFAAEYEDMLKKMTKKELIEAYAANMAVVSYTTDSLLTSPMDEEEVGEVDKVEDEEAPSSLPSVGQSSSSATLTMRKHALLIKEQLLSTLSDEIRQSVEEDSRTEEEEKLEEAARSLKRKVGIQGGAAMNVKRVLQYNLNIEWADTIRNALLFLFFGYLGARDPISRMLMLGAAPMCFIIQARPVKIALKQLFYAIGKPPAIILSLLPAPQQAVMGLDYDAVMKDLFGSNFDANKKSIEGEIEGEQRVVDASEDESESEQEEEDDEEDDEYE